MRKVRFMDMHERKNRRSLHDELNESVQKSNSFIDGRGDESHHRRRYKETNVPIVVEESLWKSVISYVRSLLVYLCRQLIFKPPQHKLTYYTLIIIACSVIHSLDIPDKSVYLANKKNILNVLFIKNGWFWTLLLGVPFVVLSQCSVSSYNVASIARAILRLMVATFFWYGITSWFEQIQMWTGSHCVNLTSDIVLPSLNKNDCLKIRNTRWNHAGVDLSGHVFLITYSLLILTEEAQPYVRFTWSKSDRMKDRTIKEIRRRIGSYTDVIFILMGLLCVLWEGMLVSTCLYFHKFLHKITAYLITVAIWFVTYQFYYVQSSVPNPGLP
ncbi:hypothetical protein ACOME3_003715 [Neoechinorhynchus agilis]